MSRSTGSDVSSAKQRFGYQSQNVVIFGDVENAIAIPTHGDQARQSQFGKVLRDSGRGRSNMLGKVVDGMLAMQQ